MKPLSSKLNISVELNSKYVPVTDLQMSSNLANGIFICDVGEN